MSDKSEKKNWHEQVAEEIIEQIKAGTAPWMKTWRPGESMDMPHNPTTGKAYRGMNAMWLMMQGHNDPRWLTYKQAQSEGAQVRKGEKSCKITYWKTHDERTETNVAGEKITVRTELERPRSFHALVFNAAQIDGLPPLEPRKMEEWEAHQRAEKILAGSGASIRHVSGNRAYYSPGTDSITLPERSQFSDANGYYSTALHELGHWTGHSARLNRDLTGGFGSPEYAREELRAEISSMLTGRELGIGHNPQNTAAYAASWIQALQSDPMEIHRATRDAAGISRYMLDFEQDLTKTQESIMENQWEIHDITIIDGFPGIHAAAVSVTASRGDGPRLTTSEYLGHDGRLVTGADSLHDGDSPRKKTISFWRHTAQEVEQAIQQARADIDHLNVIDTRPDPTSDTGGQIVDIRIGERVRVLGVQVSPDMESTDAKIDVLAGPWAAEITRKILDAISLPKIITEQKAHAAAGTAELVAEQAPGTENHQTLYMTPFFRREFGREVSPQLAGEVIGTAVVHMSAQYGQGVPETVQNIATTPEAADHFRWLIESADVEFSLAGWSGSVSAHLDDFYVLGASQRFRPISQATRTPEMSLDD